jgi:hypothetical protein
MLLLRLLLCTLLLGTTAWPAPHAHADALRRLEKETDHEHRTQRSSPRRRRSSSSSNSSASRDRSSGDWTQTDRDDTDSSDRAQAIALLLILPWGVPHMALEARGDQETARENNCLRGYARYPFADGPGLLRNSCEPGATPSKKLAIALGAESGFMLQGVLPATFAGRLLLPKRVELSARTDWLHDLASRANDRAVMTTAHLVFRFAQAKRVDFRTGIGPRHFKRDESRYGLDILYAIDIYGRHPIICRMEFHVGFLGDALLGQARATLGGMIGRVELYAGYDQTRLSDGHGSGTPLGGPVAGMRAWF